MVSSKHFLICILLAMLKNVTSIESVNYSNNAINTTTGGPTYILSTSNFVDTSSSLSSIFPDTDGKNQIETTTKLENKYTTYGEESLPKKGAEKIIKNSLNSKDYLNSESEYATKVVRDITPTANVTKFKKKCDIRMNNGDPKSVRADICGCADGYEIIEYDEFKNKINKTCVELLPETTTNSEEIKTTISLEEQKEMRTPLLHSTNADFITSRKPKENDIENISFSKTHVTTQTNVNNHNSRFVVVATTSVGPNNGLDDSDATTKPAMSNIATTLSAETRLRNNSDNSTESNTLAKQDVSYDSVGTSSTPFIKLSSLTRRRENFHPNGSQMTYYIIGSALVTAMIIVSGILYFRNLRRKSHYEI